MNYQLPNSDVVEAVDVSSRDVFPSVTTATFESFDSLDTIWRAKPT